MKRYACVATIILLGLLLLTLFNNINSQAATLAWKYQTIDTNIDANAILKFDFVLDSAGYPHAVYNTGHLGKIDLMYAVWTGSSWRVQTVDSNLSEQTGVLFILDSFGNPHICYFDDENNVLKYASWTGSNWNIQTINENGIEVVHLFMLDSKGNPKIYFEEWNNYENLEKYALWTGSKWIIQPSDTNNFHPRVLDSKGNAHTIYWANGLIYSSWNGKEWSTSVVDPTPKHSGDLSVDLKFDSNDRPHIVYNSDSGLKYAVFTGSYWLILPVDTSESLHDPNLVLDSKGNPQISYYYSQEYPINVGTTHEDSVILWSSIKYANFTNSRWVIQTVDKIENMSISSMSFILDSKGNPFISYTSGNYYHTYPSYRTPGDLRYASWNGTDLSVQTIEFGGVWKCILQLDSNSNPILCYFNGAGELVIAYLGNLPSAPIRTFNPVNPEYYAVIIVIAIGIVILALLLLKKRHSIKPKNNSLQLHRASKLEAHLRVNSLVVDQKIWQCCLLFVPQSACKTFLWQNPKRSCLRYLLVDDV
jgi:hypothetical protein